MRRGNWLRHAGFFLVAAVSIAGYSFVIDSAGILRDTHVPPVHASLLHAIAGFFGVGAALSAAVSIWSGPRLERSLQLRRSLFVAVACIWLAALSYRPITSVDNSFNALMARTLVVYHQNPYLTPSGTHTLDPIFPYTSPRWHKTPMVYGPLYVLLSAVPISLVPDPILQTIALRFCNAAGYVLAGYMLFRFLRKRSPDAGWTVLAFWLLNPVAALEMANAGHNEGLLLPFFALLAVALQERRLWRAALAIVGAASVKLWPIILAPVLLGVPATWRLRIRVAAASTALLAALWLPFWAGPTTFDGIRALAGNIDGSWYLAPFRYLSWLVFASAGRADAFQASASAALIGFFACAVAIGLLVWKKRLSPLGAAVCLMLAYHLVWLNWLQPWYALALFPFVVVACKDRAAVACMAAACVVSAAAYVLTPPLAYGGAMVFIGVLAAFFGKQKTAKVFAALRRNDSD